MGLFERIGQRLGERAFEDAVAGGAPDRALPSIGIAVAFVLSFAVLASPFLIAASAVAIAYHNYPAPMALIIAALLLAFSWFLLPKRAWKPKRLLERDRLPETFWLVDAVGAVLSAPRVDAIAIDNEFNAYLAEPGRLLGRKTRVLGLGMLLWVAATNEERIALVAHELGHATNGDPRRGHVIGLAIEVLDRWTAMLDRDLARNSSVGTGLSGLFVEFLYLILHGAIGLFAGILNTATMYRSQIAEYRADASAARVAGADGILGLLEKLTLSTEASMFHNLYGTYNRRQKGSELVTSIVARLQELDPEERRAILEKAGAEQHRIDMTHPPTVFRQAFIRRHATFLPALNATDIDFDAIDRELAAFVDQAGNELAAQRDASLQ